MPTTAEDTPKPVNCAVCNNEISESPTTHAEKSLECECCMKWIHTNCVKPRIDVATLKVITNLNLHWYCPPCEGAASKLHQWSVKLQAEQDSLKADLTNLKDRMKAAEDKINGIDKVTLKQEIIQELKQEQPVTKQLVKDEVTATMNAFREENPPTARLPDSPNTSSVRLTAAVKDAIAERENIDQRKLNLILYNLSEAADPTEDVTQVQDLISNKLKVNEEIVITDSTRLGKVRSDGKPRLLRITLETLSMKRKILSTVTKLRQLEENDKFHKVYIRPDLTPKQQEESKNLYTQLKTTRELNPDNQYKILKGKIIQTQPPIT